MSIGLIVAGAYLIESQARAAACLTAASPETLDKLALAHEKISQCEQIPITTEHVIHGGMYARTIRLQPWTVMVGSLIKLATILIVNGSTFVLAGDDWVELKGYNVIAGCAGRKQLFVALGVVEITMIFPTQAKTVEQAEEEVFAEVDLLMSRKDGSSDTAIITGC